MNYYILIDGEPVLQPDILAWAHWFETADRVVQQTEVHDVLVSTVFLGCNHNFRPGPPILWETMIFADPPHEALDGWQRRYSSKEAAIEDHAAAVQIVRDYFKE